MAGVMDFPVTFTQNGCDVTGSITVGPNGTLVATPGCPITLTGKVDSTGAASGTWHAYCNIETDGATSSDGTTDSGYRHIWGVSSRYGEIQNRQLRQRQQQLGRQAGITSFFLFFKDYE
jgi:hypothetical protein